MTDLTDDQDFIDLIAAWHGNVNFPSERREELLRRLAEDEALRRELAQEVQMAGLTRTVQASEPRWLRLEEILGASEETSQTENLIMSMIAKRGRAARIPTLGWLAAGAIAASLVLATILWTGAPSEPGIARIIRIEGTAEKTANLRWETKFVPEKNSP